jgi:PAS domain S-box-containing protein
MQSESVSGEPITLLQNSFPIKTEKGYRIGIILYDITERKRAENMLRESEEKYHSLITSISEGIVMQNRIGEIIASNPSAERVLGLTREQMTGQIIIDTSWYTIHADGSPFPGEDYPALVTLQTGESLRNVVIGIRNPNGELTWVNANSEPLFHPNDSLPYAVVTSFTDITERKQIEAALQESEANLRAVFNAATDESIYLIAADETLLALNEVVAQNMSQSREALVGRKLFSLMSADDAAHYRPFIARALLNGEDILFEDEWNDRWMMYHLYPIFNGNGQVVRLAIYSRDITLQKQAEEASRLQGNELEKRVQERTAELVRASRVKDEFLATVSHELRTPLSGILGYSEALLEGMRGPMTEKQEKAVQIIYSSGGHLLGLINDILDISKIESSQFELHPENINVNEICQSSLVFIEQLANKKSMTVEYSIPSIVPVIFADPKRLKQILVNLLSNAVKFTPNGGMVKLEIKPSAEESLVRFSVTDTGIGISPDDLQKLFKPFVQVDSSLSRQYEGSGLGLALVKKMVDLHNGSIEVKSEVGVGSRFTFTLPCSQQASLNLQILP